MASMCQPKLEVVRSPPVWDDVNAWKATARDALFTEDGFQ